eukprot:13929670-Ditylum_brightwellii.AAC.1
MIRIFKEGDSSSWSVSAPVPVPSAPVGIIVGGFLPFLCCILPGDMILDKMASIIIIVPSVANGAEPDTLLFTMLCPVMVKILDAFRRHLIPYLVLVGAIILVMTILIAVGAALRCGRGMITLILGPGLFASGSYFLMEEWTVFSTA